MTPAAAASTTSPGVVRGALMPSLGVVVVCVLTGWTLAGAAGALGAVIGGAASVGGLGFGQLALRAFRHVAPIMLMVLALTSYALQVVVLLALYAAFERHPGWSEQVSPSWIGISIFACTLACTVLLIRAAKRERLPLYDLSEAAR